MEYHFCGCVASDLKTIKCFIKNRIDELNRYVEDNSKLLEIKLIVNELVINGALHGNELSEKKAVFLRIDLNDEAIKISVSDEGKGFDYKIENYNPKEMRSTGRGLLLVYNLADDMELVKNKVNVIINI